MTIARKIGSVDAESFVEIGKGTYGKVYKALHDEKVSAIKILYYRQNEFEADRVSATAEVAVMEELTLAHAPHTVRLIAYQFYAAHCNIVMDYLEKSTFTDYFMRKKAPITLEIRLQILKELLEALIFLKALGYFHCDIKPSNLLIDNELHMKLCDFGLARKFKDLSIIAGTVIFMAPEILEAYEANPRPLTTTINEKTESFSVAATAYSVFSLKMPHKNRGTRVNNAELLKKLKGPDREPIPENCPPNIERLINTSWGAAPQQRFDFDAMLDLVKTSHTNMRP